MEERLTRELDQETAHAIALMTLFATAKPDDDRRAAALLGEYLAEPDGVRPTIAGFESLCGVLLAIIDFETGVSVEETLQRIGVMTAVAELANGR